MADHEDDVQAGKVDVAGGDDDATVHPTATRSPKRNAIADAVTARLNKQHSGTGNVDDGKQRTAHKNKVRKIINEISGAVTYEKAYDCLKLVHTLLDNILAHPTETKYRSFRASQPKIARQLLSLDRATDLLIEAGFRKRSHDFQEEWFVPGSEQWNADSLGMQRLLWTRDTIGERMVEYEENAERVRAHMQMEKEMESNRKAHALANAQEDRERVAMRTERERTARRVAEERARAEEEQAQVASNPDQERSTDTP